MAYSDIEYEVEEDELRATIRFDRPEKMNPLSTGLLAELQDALLDAEDNDAVRAIVLTGNGRAFSAGFDLSESGDADEMADEARDGDSDVPSTDDILDRMETISAHLHTIWNLNKPVIAAVNGYCLAGASDLAMVCDIVIASDRAEFGYPGQRMAGHPPALTYPFFMGLHQAKELLFTGKTVDAERASEMGIFNRVVPHEELMAAAYDEVDQIAKVPGGGVRIQKHSLNALLDQQGFKSTLKMSEMLDPLAHLTAVGKEYYALEDIDERMEWMNERDKTMRDVRD